MGNPAKIDGEPTWEISDPELATLEKDEANPFQVTVKTTGKLGFFQVRVSADADLGEGVSTIQGTLDIEVQASMAARFDIEVQAPSDRV